ncbi:hypothetical protein ACQRXC_14840 [Niallia taxi]|uniref:hypothetical protein n=1 Tax=Niallia taxi TaxID=2499688 RepID=UPI003F603120
MTDPGMAGQRFKDPSKIGQRYRDSGQMVDSGGSGMQLDQVAVEPKKTQEVLEDEI